MKEQTTGKAWAAAVTTFVTVGGAMLGFGEMPSDDMIMKAFIVLATASGSAVASFAMTWLKRNYPKGLRP